MKKIVLSLLAVSLCATAGMAARGKVLDNALKEAAQSINQKLEKGTKVALLNFNSPADRLSDYALSELEAALLESGKLTIIDRKEINLIRGELAFQASDEVDDKEMQELGRLVGAQSIVSGSFTDLGRDYRMVVRVLNVQTALVAAQYRSDVRNDRRFKALLKGGKTARPAATAQPARQATVGSVAAPSTAAATYKVGDTGPAGGLIFYDKGNSIGGWRYLEAAPAEYEKVIEFWAAPFMSCRSGDYSLLSRTKGRTVGNGFKNTQILLEAYNQNGGGFNTAIRYCADLEVKGFDDWFLPSMDELSWMYGNLYMKGVGRLSSVRYWSSTTGDGQFSYAAYAKDFAANKEEAFCSKEPGVRARPVRRF